MAPVQICVFNPVTTFIDQVTAASVGPGIAGQPVVLNSLGFLDSSLFGQGVIATAGQNLSPGNLVNLYSQSGTLHAQLAYAADAGTAPSGAAYPRPASGFVSSQIFTGGTGAVSFIGTFVYIDGNAEFGVNDIGTIVFLSPVTPGGVTKTAPTVGSPPPGQLDQSVGYVVGFAAPNKVTVAFSAAFLDFTQINGILPISKGGTNAVTAPAALINLIGGSPASGDALVWNGTAWVPDVLPVIGGGTGATTGAAALINLIGGSPASGDALVWSGTAWVPSASSAITGTITAGQVAFGAATANTISGSANFTFNSGNVTLTGGQVLVPSGSVSAPSYTFTGTSGMYPQSGVGSPPARGIGFAIEGVNAFSIYDNEVIVPTSLAVNGAETITTPDGVVQLNLVNSGAPAGNYLRLKCDGSGQGSIQSAIGGPGVSCEIDFNSGALLALTGSGVVITTDTDVAFKVNGSPNPAFDLICSDAVLTIGGPHTVLSMLGASGVLQLNGQVSGSASISVASAAGTPATLLLPITTGLASQALVTDGNNPQQTSWGNPIFTSGSAGAPSIAFIGAAGTGMYLLSTIGSPPSFELGISVNGVLQFAVEDDGVAVTGHLNTSAANGDLSGNISSVGGTTVSKVFAVSFTQTPVVVVTPTTNAGAFYLSSVSNTGFTVTYANTGAQTFNYMVIGNPN
jgi:hypothetical protein